MENQIKKFKVGETYRGMNGIGTCAIEIVRRTEKSVWVKTSMDKNKRCLITIQNWNDQNCEYINYRSWGADATDKYSVDKQIEDAYYEAYCR